MKSKSILIGLVGLLFFPFSLLSQIIVIKNDTISVETDTLIQIVIDDYRGNLSWQCSTDSISWFTSKHTDTLKLRVFYPLYYRAEIADRSCFPTYSDIIKIDSKDSLKYNLNFSHFLNSSLGKDTVLTDDKNSFHCKKIDDDYIFEGDIKMNTKAIITKGAGLPINQLSHRYFGTRWPNGQVFYKINVDSENLTEKIKSAISYWNLNTKLKFIEQTNQTNFINFVSGNINSSHVGMKGGEQILTLTENGAIIHEIGHAIGLFHEHSRPDRCTYVDVHAENLRKQEWRDQLKITPYAETYGEPYDFRSIMHYRASEWPAELVYDPDQPIFTYKGTKDPIPTQEKILSEGDINMINKLYLPSVSIVKAIEITSNTLSFEGNVSNEGGAPVIERGICWRENYQSSCVNNGSGTGNYVVTIQDLKPGKTYYIQAYAKNNIGTSYSKEIWVNTKTSQPTVTTSPATNITSTLATLNGKVTSDGGTPITQRGFYWCEKCEDPGAGDSIALVDGTIGNFSYQLTNLKPKTSYTYTAFATNKQGTETGNVFYVVTDAEPQLGRPQLTAPDDFAIFNKTTTKTVNIAWDNITGADEYWLNVFPEGQSASPVFDASVGSATNKTIAINTQENGIYVFQVRARKTGGEWSIFSASRQFIADTPPVAPAITAPANEASITRNTSQTFSWNKPSTGIDRYYLRIVSGTDFNATPVYEKELNVSSQAVNCTWAPGTYTWTVRAMKETPEGYSKTDYENTIDWGSYAQNRTFVITEAVSVPTITTSAVTAITQTTATSGGNVTSDGGLPVTARGICWSTSPKPTVDSTKTTDSSGTGSFSSSLTGLTAKTTYYVRAYATNSKGTAYGNEVSFETSSESTATGTFTDARDGKTYKTVKIGEQVWMAENLAYDVGDGCWAYDNDESYVATYGRIYTWEAAKAAPPSGWHLPTDDEWKQLEMVIGMSQSEVDDAGLRGTTEGTKLKATSGWNNNGNGTDDFGFSALPGGSYHRSGKFVHIDITGYWWSATENLNTDAEAWYRAINYESTGIFRYSSPKNNGRSVRCVKDIAQTVTVPTVTTSAVTAITQTTATSGGNITSNGGSAIIARGVCWSTSPKPTVDSYKTTDGSGTGSFSSSLTGLTANTTYYVRAYATNSKGTAYGNEVRFETSPESNVTGTFTDTRDGKTYKTVKIGEQVWMAENLAYDVGDGCWVYNNDESNAATYGYLYTWQAAKAACPTGWHLPTDDEWKQLEMAIGMSQSEADKTDIRGTNEGTKLKATNGWYYNANGTDDFGFSALPGGYRNSYGNFDRIGKSGNWWSATERNSSTAWCRNMDYNFLEVYRTNLDKGYGHSVRCVRD